ncbi:DoxX family protein [Carboxylicivirga linearis]|uniref:DoxX family membrane protein n=1 Tax=Carboxylicivirga linearis TaxID=1628157 RepID=A0ABS5JV62_9BACT|nr:DoxX family membrane protein [Carboxylicivirga linearis]MBS2098790.1 DoxX family membrane protein [Carboxylicivirga linearis]
MKTNILNSPCSKTNIWQSIFRILLGSFMVYAGTGHLLWLRTEFVAQVPTWLAFDTDFVVLASGVVEILLGLSMIFSGKYKVIAGLALAIFYVLIFPGNISQYINQVDAFGLDTDRARFIRLFFQPVLIIWALWSTGVFCVMFNKNRQ